MEVGAQEAAATAAVALAEAAKVAARMALALAVVERVAVGLRLGGPNASFWARSNGCVTVKAAEFPVPA